MTIEKKTFDLLAGLAGINGVTLFATSITGFVCCCCCLGKGFLEGSDGVDAGVVFCRFTDDAGRSINQSELRRMKRISLLIKVDRLFTLNRGRSLNCV